MIEFTILADWLTLMFMGLWGHMQSDKFINRFFMVIMFLCY